jgi:transcriptional regulator GlxA family with amidase domain
MKRNPADALPRRVIAHRLLKTAGADGERLVDVIAWAPANLDRPLPVDALAARAMMSRRSFVRHFKAATGTTPHAWLVSQRLNLAEELLETTDLAIEQVADRVGYRSAAVFREQFTLRRRIAPRHYRRTFRRSDDHRSAD